MFKAGGKACSRESYVLEHALADRAEMASFRQVVQRPSLFWRPIVVGIAIGERETPDALRVACGKNLSDSAAAVVGDDIHLVEFHGLAERCEHARLGVERKVLVRAGACSPMRENIDRYAAPGVGNPLDQPVPEMAVQQNAMNEDCHRSRSGFPIRDVSKIGCDIFVLLI